MLFTRGEVSDVDVTLTYKYVINHFISRVSLLPDKVSNIKVRVQIQLTAVQRPFCRERNKRALLECGCSVFGRMLASL